MVIVWFLGGLRAKTDVFPHVLEAVPGGSHVVGQGDGLFAVWEDSSETVFAGYVAVGTADGYGGPLTLVAATSPAGAVTGVDLVAHKESLLWIERVLDSGLVHSLLGKQYSDPFVVGDDVDGVTGATYTSKAMAEATLAAGRMAAEQLKLPMEPARTPEIVFGLPEMTLLLLFAAGYLGHRGSFKYTKQIRWASMIVGLVVIGFVYNSPLTLAYFTKLLLGYWPQWQTNLYWYLLLGGVLLAFTVDNKNPYCQWFCPFGAAQECLGAFGGAKARQTQQFRAILKWLQRGLALAALLLGLYFRSPGMASYELFSTLFSLVGDPLTFVALGLVLIASLFIKRPWCNFLCPLRPVTDLVKTFREMVREQWQSIRAKTRTP